MTLAAYVKQTHAIVAVTHKVPGLSQLGIYKHGPKLWYVVDLQDGGILGGPSDTLTAAIAYAQYRADIGGYR